MTRGQISACSINRRGHRRRRDLTQTRETVVLFTLQLFALVYNSWFHIIVHNLVRVRRGAYQNELKSDEFVVSSLWFNVEWIPPLLL